MTSIEKWLSVICTWSIPDTAWDTKKYPARAHAPCEVTRSTDTRGRGRRGRQKKFNNQHLRAETGLESLHMKEKKVIYQTDMLKVCSFVFSLVRMIAPSSQKLQSYAFSPQTMPHEIGAATATDVGSRYTRAVRAGSAQTPCSVR